MTKLVSLSFPINFLALFCRSHEHGSLLNKKQQRQGEEKETLAEISFYFWYIAFFFIGEKNSNKKYGRIKVHKNGWIGWKKQQMCKNTTRKIILHPIYYAITWYKGCKQDLFVTEFSSFFGKGELVVSLYSNITLATQSVFDVYTKPKSF